MSREAVEARIAAHPVTGNPQQMRRAFDALAGSGPEGEPKSLGGVPARSFGAGPPVVWLHGGGYVFGSPQSHAAAATALARRAGVGVYVPDYRLAPEHAWPAPLEDACRFVEAFGAPVPVVGDSAGGHLALTLARKMPQAVSALALISPNTDRTGLSTTRGTDADAMNDDDQDRALWETAMPDTAPDDPDASPVTADLTGLPPVFVTAAVNEVLLDDTLLLIRALGRAGVPVSAVVIPPLFHMWTLWPEELAQARATMSRISQFPGHAA